MLVTSHKLNQGAFASATSCGGPDTMSAPSLIILHDTAGRLDKHSSVNWFTSEDCNTSAHVVVERDGTLTQLVKFNTIAYHAGKSTWNGVPNCNRFAIGIEI